MEDLKKEWIRFPKTKKKMSQMVECLEKLSTGVSSSQNHISPEHVLVVSCLGRYIATLDTN